MRPSMWGDTPRTEQRPLGYSLTVCHSIQYGQEMATLFRLFVLLKQKWRLLAHEWQGIANRVLQTFIAMTHSIVLTHV